MKIFLARQKVQQMERLKLFFILCLIGVVFQTPLSLFADECTPLKTSPSLKLITELLQKEHEAKSSWSNYKLSNNYVVFVDLEKDAKCVVLSKEGKITRSFNLDQPLTLQNGVFSYFINGKDEDQLANLPDLFKTLDIENALIWNLSFKWPPQLPQEYLLELMAHEGFHLFVQDSGQYPWPSWVSSENQLRSITIRKELVKKCYLLDSNVTSITKKELESLSSSVSDFFSNNLTKAHSDGKNFIYLRNKRYELLKDVTINLGQKGMGCPQIEASYEMEEGIPDFVGESAMLVTQTMAPEQLLKLVGELFSVIPDNEPYYAFGALQMFVIAGLNSDFNAVIERLSYSMDFRNGIFAEFKNTLSVEP